MTAQSGQVLAQYRPALVKSLLHNMVVRSRWARTNHKGGWELDAVHHAAQVRAAHGLAVDLSPGRGGGRGDKGVRVSALALALG